MSRILVLKKSHGRSCGAVNGNTGEKGRGVFSEDISMLEACAMVVSMRRFARTQYDGSIRQRFSLTIGGLFSLLNVTDLATWSFDTDLVLPVILSRILALNVPPLDCLQAQ